MQNRSDLGGTYDEERQIAILALDRAGVRPPVIVAAIAADDYFMRRLGLSLDDPMNVPRRYPDVG